MEPDTDYINRPDYIGVVSGAQHRLESAEGVTEYALIFATEEGAHLFEASATDLRYLARQITGLVGGE